LAGQSTESRRPGCPFTGRCALTNQARERACPPCPTVNLLYCWARQWHATLQECSTGFSHQQIVAGDYICISYQSLLLTHEFASSPVSPSPLGAGLLPVRRPAETGGGQQSRCSSADEWSSAIHGKRGQLRNSNRLDGRRANCDSCTANRYRKGVPNLEDRRVMAPTLRPSKGTCNVWFLPAQDGMVIRIPQPLD
jgi:hypothetical protein